METFFARHTHDIDIDAPTRARLWNEQWVAVHYPDYLGGGIGEQDNESLNPDDYPGRAMRAIRALQRLAENGGYVCAQYHDHDDYLIGKIAARTPIKLLRGTWGSIWGNEGRPAVLKALQLHQVKVVNAKHYPALAQALLHRPRRGTLQRWWQDGGVIRDIVEAG